MDREAVTGVNPVTSNLSPFAGRRPRGLIGA
jgi:hypothetical protein